MAREILQPPALKPRLRREVLSGDGVTGGAMFDHACQMARTDHHPVGTCAMGPVDADLAVPGIEGLRVCDASVMPRSPSCHTNAPTIMIAKKAADIIRGPALVARGDVMVKGG